MINFDKKSKVSNFEADRLNIAEVSFCRSNIFLMCGSHWVQSQGCAAVDPSIRHLAAAFLERLRDSARTKVFYSQVFMQDRMYVGGRNAQG